MKLLLILVKISLENMKIITFSLILHENYSENTKITPKFTRNSLSRPILEWKSLHTHRKSLAHTEFVSHTPRAKQNTAHAARAQCSWSFSCPLALRARRAPHTRSTRVLEKNTPPHQTRSHGCIQLTQQHNRAWTFTCVGSSWRVGYLIHVKQIMWSHVWQCKWCYTWWCKWMWM